MAPSDGLQDIPSISFRPFTREMAFLFRLSKIPYSSLVKSSKLSSPGIGGRHIRLVIIWPSTPEHKPEDASL
eukprot:scaffold16029_cov67-Skeletonema_dohrnii-CCMP3373.AAC.1